LIKNFKLKIKNSKVLIISGPTATGKTGVAIKLAQKYNGELISADSRQIYKGMDIGTGKDLNKNSIFNFQFSINNQNVGFYLIDKTPVWLLDIINPNQSFSVAQYRQLALKAIDDIISRGKLPIIVGGTGQYIESIINPQDTFNIKPNYFLRLFLNRLPVRLLQLTLRLLDIKTFRLLNNSDVNNSRRLIRRIEIKLSRKSLLSKRDLGRLNTFHISLTDNIDNIISKIDTRIQSRLDLGLIDEIKNLLIKYKWTDPGLNTLAYYDFKPCLVRTHYDAFLQSCIDNWSIHEHQYARRQKTWFKKFTPNYFIDISKPNSYKQIDSIVSKWYNKRI